MGGSVPGTDSYPGPPPPIPTQPWKFEEKSGGDELCADAMAATPIKPKKTPPTRTCCLKRYERMYFSPPAMPARRVPDGVVDKLYSGRQIVPPGEYYGLAKCLRSRAFCSATGRRCIIRHRQ